MTMREVRCCCDGRLLGWLPKRGIRGEVVRFNLLVYRPSLPATWDAPVEVEVETLELEVARFSGITLPHGADWVLAYKSRDHPIERLRRLPGWVDVDTTLAPYHKN